VLTKSECNAIIQRAEEAGFEPALLNTGYGREVYRPEKRNSDRVIIDAKEFAVKLYERLKEVLPETYSWEGSSDRSKVAGLNERMRILRYKPGHSFAAHSDGPYKRPWRTFFASIACTTRSSWGNRHCCNLDKSG
jgi:prolyl 4-hydroxylase